MHRTNSCWSSKILELLLDTSKPEESESKQTRRVDADSAKYLDAGSLTHRLPLQISCSQAQGQVPDLLKDDSQESQGEQQSETHLVHISPCSNPVHSVLASGLVMHDNL